ncbi:hypothetical protein ACLBR5_28905 [Escherichia coli]
MPPDGLVQRSTRIKRIQTTAMLLLFFAAVINYLDRSSLSVAKSTIREEFGISVILKIRALLSWVFTRLRDCVLLRPTIDLQVNARRRDWTSLVTVPGHVWHGAQL